MEDQWAVLTWAGKRFSGPKKRNGIQRALAARQQAYAMAWHWLARAINRLRPSRRLRAPRNELRLPRVGGAVRGCVRGRGGRGRWAGPARIWTTSDASK